MILKRPTIVINKAPANDSFVAIATYIPIRRWRDVSKATKLSNQVERHIRQAPGAICYSLAVNPLRLQFWTCSIWTDRASAEAFVRAEPHATAIVRYTAWAASGSALADWDCAHHQLDWQEAFERLKDSPRTESTAA